jgi:asparagine synthase (glutamine-hydrolysing)
MCGIAGIVALGDGADAPAREQLAAMAGVLSHRGPESAGVYFDHRAGLAHTRLSIIDLATGAQPLSNEDGTLWITFNGEVFNYIELRAELEQLGHLFKTRSDTEVIVHAYESWGSDAFERFNGQFACALWDRAARRLVLARDPLGVRPIYTCEHAGRVYFASEVKAIFAADPTISRAIDPAGIDEVFTFWSTVPPQTVFAGVSELEPGHVVVYANGGRTERAFVDARCPPARESGFRGTIDEAAEAVRLALERATRLRMLRSDVPVGCYLSGGLDSSLVAALAQREVQGRLRTFSLRFEDEEFDETPYQRLMVERLESEHHEVEVSRADIAAAFPDVVYHAERPVLRTAPAPLFLLARLVRESGIKVVVTGEGADEVFAGYDLFREAKIRRFWARQPDSSLRPLLLGRLYPYMARSPVAAPAIARQFFGLHLERWAEPGFGHEPRWRSTSALKRLFSDDFQLQLKSADPVRRLVASLPPEFSGWPPLSQDQYLEMRTLLAGYILPSQGDRMMMGHSVEGRFPFLDKDVVFLANSLPSRYKLRGLDEKHVLKRAFSNLLPVEILRRKKQPYRAPDAVSFLGPHAPDWVAGSLSSDAIRAAGVFDAERAALAHRKFHAQNGDRPASNADNMAIVGIVSTQVLYERLIRQAPAAGRNVTWTTVVDGRHASPDGSSAGGHVTVTR